MKKIAIGLFVLEGLALISKLLFGKGFHFDAPPAYWIGELVGFFIPAIIGAILLIVSSRK